MLVDTFLDNYSSHTLDYCTAAVRTVKLLSSSFGYYPLLTMSDSDSDSAAAAERDRKHHRRGEAARPGESEADRRQRVNAARRARAEEPYFEPRFCRLCDHPTTLYTSQTGLNGHTSSKHKCRYRTRGDAYIPFTAAELQRVRDRAASGQPRRRRRAGPADKLGAPPMLIHCFFFSLISRCDIEDDVFLGDRESCPEWACGVGPGGPLWAGNSCFWPAVALATAGPVWAASDGAHS